MAELALIFVMLVASLSYSGAVPPQEHSAVHRVVGGDQGWDVSSMNLPGWSADKKFKVGDSIWFTYSAAKGGVAEVRSKEQFEACDVSNPIRMYTDGINEVVLDGEGHRYFVSGDAASCKDGLKLHFDVQQSSSEPTAPKTGTEAGATVAAAQAPSHPSAAAHGALFSAQAWVVGFLVLCFVLAF